MTDTPDAVYMTGGSMFVEGDTVDGHSSIAAKFYFDQSAQQDKWKKLSNLKQGRQTHASIMTGKNIIFVGGKTDEKHSLIEVWDIESDKSVMKVDPSPENDYKTKFYRGIAIFPVNANFCKK